MIIVQLAELGVLYRRVFNYIQSKQDPSRQDSSQEASMTEQVSSHHNLPCPILKRGIRNRVSAIVWKDS